MKKQNKKNIITIITLDLVELFQNDEAEKSIKEKISNKMNDKTLFNQIDKENICDNINF